MNVKLISYTPEAERKVAMAARLCYSPIGAAELEERLSDAQVNNLVQ
jgi:thymidylate synthase (FAD)